MVFFFNGRMNIFQIVFVGPTIDLFLKWEGDFTELFIRLSNFWDLGYIFLKFGFHVNRNLAEYEPVFGIERPNCFELATLLNMVS